MSQEHPLTSCVELAVRYIQVELQEDRVPSLGNIAAASGISKYHFHRIYKLLTGETCNETVTRLRLAKSAALLRQPKISITEAAIAAGYSSSQAFAKAIKKALSVSPSELRSDPERLASSIRTLLEPVDASKKLDSVRARIEICSLEPLRVILVRTQDKYPDLADTYWRLVGAVGEPENIGAILGLPHRDTSTFQDGDFIYDCALLPTRPVANLPSDMRHYSIAAGTYLLVRHKGLDADLPDTLDELYAVILAAPGIQLADTPCIHHFIDDPEEVAESECRTDIYVKIETM